MLEAAVVLSVAHYDFCRIQRTLGVTLALPELKLATSGGPSTCQRNIARRTTFSR